MTKKLFAEFFGTFWLVLGGCGSAVLAAGVPDVGIGYLGVAFAFGLTVLTMAYAVGGISGGHFNPAVSLGLAVAGRFDFKNLIPYWIAQLVGAIAAAAVLYVIASGKAGFVAGGFASNGYGELSPRLWVDSGFRCRGRADCILPYHHSRFHLFACTSRLRADRDWSRSDPDPSCLDSCDQYFCKSSPVDRGCLFADTAALSQLWLFWLAPLIGAAVGAFIWKFLLGKD